MLSFNCATGDIVLGRVGGDPNRAVEYLVPGVMPAGNFGPITNRRVQEGLLKDVKSERFLTITVRYVNDVASAAVLKYDFRTPCGLGSGRLAAEAEVPLTIKAIGNPTTGDNVSVEVRGAAGQALQLILTNSSGRRISQQTIPSAGDVERQTVRLGSQTDVYFIQAVTPTDRMTIKVIRN